MSLVPEVVNWPVQRCKVQSYLLHEPSSVSVLILSVYTWCTKATACRPGCRGSTQPHKQHFCGTIHC